MHLAIAGSRGYPHVYGGYETLVAEIAPRLVARGHRVTVYCHAELFEQRPHEVNGVRLVYVRGSSGKSLSQLSHSLTTVLHLVRWRRDRPDVAVFVNAANGLFGPLLRAAGVRTAINVDGMEWKRPKWAGLGARVYYRAAKMATRWFDLVITDANAMADVYRSEFGSESTVIEYGAHQWHSSAPELIAGLGLERHGYFLIVGRLIPDNNVRLLVEGFVASNSRRKLVVVGDVTYQDEYAESVRGISDPRVRFQGYVRDQNVLRELYCGAYAYMHGHEHGGTNPALLKALGAGCCVLALDTSFAREVLDGERYGICFPKSAEGVSRAIEKVEAAPELAEGLRIVARNRISERYTWERIVDEYERACARLAARGATG